MRPHLHLRGKSFQYLARYPDGSKEILLEVPEYDFNWQTRYLLAEPKRVPAGTELVLHRHLGQLEFEPRAIRIRVSTSRGGSRPMTR